MKRIIFLLLGITLLVTFSTCRKEHIAPINQLVKDLFCFKEGSEWTYYDSLSQTTQKMVITNYNPTYIAPATKWGKVYECAEWIEMNINIENTMKSLFINQEAFFQTYVDRDNEAGGYIITPGGNRLSIYCDKNNNFSHPVTYLGNYTINGTNYSDVYLFDIIDGISAIDKYTLYVSKHTGFIRCIRQSEYAEYYNFDLVLIDKNVQQ